MNNKGLSTVKILLIIAIGFCVAIIIYALFANSSDSFYANVDSYQSLTDGDNIYLDNGYFQALQETEGDLSKLGRVTGRYSLTGREDGGGDGGDDPTPIPGPTPTPGPIPGGGGYLECTWADNGYDPAAHSGYTWLQAHYPAAATDASYFHVGGGLASCTLNGHVFIYEKQGAYWNSVSNGIYNGSEHSVAGVGCGTFASTAAVFALTGEIHSCAEFFDECRSSFTNINWSTSVNKWTGSQTKTTFGAEYMSHFGLTATPISGITNTMDAYNYMATNGFNGKCYIVHGGPSFWSTTEHWCCVVGAHDGVLDCVNLGTHTKEPDNSPIDAFYVISR